MKKKKRNIFIYPEKITEVFDGADFHIKYCLSFIKRYLYGDILEVGAGCGSFTRHYMNEKIDRGPIICSRECLIDDTDTAKNLYEKADGLAKEIFIKWLPIITHKKIQNLPLPAKTAAYHNKNGIKNNVDMGAAKKDIYDQVRSLEFNDFFEPPYLETSVGKEYLTISPSLGYETLLECGGSRAVYKRVWNPPLKTR